MNLLVAKMIFLLIISISFFVGLAGAEYLEITSDHSSITVGENSNITVTVYNASLVPVDNTLVNFSTNFGNLNRTSAYTDSSGVATVSINSTLVGTATINASVGTDLNSTNVTFIAGKPANIDVNVSLNPLIVGNTTVVNLTISDQYGNINSTADMDINISITDVLGNLINFTNFTKSPFNSTELQVNSTDVIPTDNTIISPGVILFINSTLAGHINITATSNNKTNYTNISFLPAEVYDFNLFCIGECSGIVNQTVNIFGEAFDVYGNPVNGSIVYFNASSPPPTKFNSPIEYKSSGFTPNTTTTSNDGKTSTVIFRTDKRAGDNTISVSAGSVNKSYIIKGETDVPQYLFLSYSPGFAYANNLDKYRFTAQITDQFKNPILPEGSLTKKVHFTMSSYNMYSLMNESGAAFAEGGPTLYIETLNVSAVYNDGFDDTGIMNRTEISFVPGNLSRFVFYANPDTVMYQPGKGNHNSSIILKALDEWGHPIPGINVTLNNTNMTLGNLTIPGINATNLISAVTDSYGGIQALFISNISVGNATITAQNDSINASVNVEIKDKTFISVNITFDPRNIISGGTVNITTILSVEGDIPVTRRIANAMLVLDNTGSMDPDYYAGTPADILLVSDNSGSMGSQINNVINAEVNFTRNLVSNNRIGLVIFSTDVGTPSLSRNVTDIQNQIIFQSSGGWTATALAIQKSKNYLVNNTRPHTRPIIILLSDGLPTKSFDGTTNNPNPKAVFEAINESDVAKKTLVNGENYIKIYTIFFDTGDPSGIDTLKAIASPDSYYYATSSNIDEVYQNIAQQISDFDISTRQYGADGFTPYNYTATGVVNNSKFWSDTISLDDNVTDFKVQIDNPNVTFTLKSPSSSSKTYPDPNFSGWLNRTGYYNVSINSSKGRYIWIEPVNDTYDPVQDSQKSVSRGNWTINVTTTNAGNVRFNITTYIDKISAVKIGSHAFISSFDAARGDRAGLATYSNIPNPPSVVDSASQSSYLLNGSTWDGYFVGSTPKKTYRLNFSGNDCNQKYQNKIGECYLLVNGRYVKDFANGSGALNYSVDITDFILNGSNTVSFYNYSYIYSNNPETKSSIRYVKIFENGTLIYQFQNTSQTLDDNPTSYTFNVSYNTTFTLSWPNATDNLSFYIYQGGTLLNKSTGAGKPKILNATIYPDKVYYIEINGTKISNETNFTVTADQILTWNSYTANVNAPLNASSSSFDLLNTSIDTMTAVGLTAIDEGIFTAGNEFTNTSLRPTMVLMTDGLDNAGYRSILQEVQRAKNNNTVIHTIGFGNSESEIDPVLAQIANTTGGQYYFAPNTSVLKSIFKGIASNMVNFTAINATLNIRTPRNNISGSPLPNAIYVTNSSNSTFNNSENFTIPTYPGFEKYNPVQSSIGENITVLSWPVPDLTVGDKWGIWYQMTITGAGDVPLILPGSNLTYLTLDDTGNLTFFTNNITNLISTNVGGFGGGLGIPPLSKVWLTANPPVVRIDENSVITVRAEECENNNCSPTLSNVTIISNLGYFPGGTQIFTGTSGLNGLSVNFTSRQAGKAHIKSIFVNFNNPNDFLVDETDVVVKPRGKIMVS